MQICIIGKGCSLVIEQYPLCSEGLGFNSWPLYLLRQKPETLVIFCQSKASHTNLDGPMSQFYFLNETGPYVDHLQCGFLSWLNEALHCAIWVQTPGLLWAQFIHHTYLHMVQTLCPRSSMTFSRVVRLCWDAPSSTLLMEYLCWDQNSLQAFELHKTLPQIGCQVYVFLKGRVGGEEERFLC